MGESNNGFKIVFVFQNNPYFEGKALWKEYITKEVCPYTPGDMDIEEIKASPISWSPGMNITVVKTQKKNKGGVKRNKNKGKEKEEARESFFRYFFKNLKPDADLPDDVMDEADSDGEPGQLMQVLMDNDHESGIALRDQIIPYAVRWYTGEAVMEDDDDEDDDSGDSDDEDESEEDDEDDEEEEDHSRQKGAGVTKPKKKKEQGKPSQKPEECKQQ